MKARLPQGYGQSQQQMMKRVQQMQADMAALQESLATHEFSATSGGGMVTATVTGEKKLTALKIDPQVIDPDDADMLGDLIIAAVNEACATCHCVQFFLVFDVAAQGPNDLRFPQ